MRLPQFLATHAEQILADWEEFARTHTASGRTMNVEALRDHAAAMLKVIAAEMVEPQTTAEQRRKARGDVVAEDGAPQTAAEEHGHGRADSGFSMEEMVSEYRALRASVIRLWGETKRELDAVDIEDLTRFNEGIDQALAESVTRYSESISNARAMFLAILGHDLRTPLGAILTAASFMQDEGQLPPRMEALAGRIRQSATRMNALVGDLLDFTRSRLGGGIPIRRSETDLSRIAGDVIDEMRALYPDREVQFAVRGDAHGRWDPARMSQAISNVVGNAVQHGTAEAAVRVELKGGGDDVVVDVHNRGPAIAEADRDLIFSPWKRATKGRSEHSDSVGLGLYIAREIVRAHGGEIDLASSQEGTRFSMRVPRG